MRKGGLGVERRGCGGEGGEQGFCGEERGSVSGEGRCGGELEGLRGKWGFRRVERGVRE